MGLLAIFSPRRTGKLLRGSSARRGWLAFHRVALRASAAAVTLTQLHATDPVAQLQTQEQVIILSAKLKKLAEIQDLLVQQQKLVLEHLDALHKDVARLERDRTNQVSRTELESCFQRIERLRAELQSNQATNVEQVCALVRELSKANTTTGAAPAPDGLENPVLAHTYKVQPGDTLLKILARANESLEKHNQPMLTLQELQRANPGITPDHIRVGQTLFIPMRAGTLPVSAGQLGVPRIATGELQ